MIFSKEEVNTGRQRELDLVKAVAIILMILIHIYENVCVGLKSPMEEAFVRYLGFPVGPTAFMFCLGMGLMYSRNRSVQSNIIRGVMVLTFGQLLIFVREMLPNFIGYLTGMGGDGSFARFALIFSVDIMQFAGLTFLAMALFKALHLKNWHIMLISLALSIVGTLVAGVSTGNYFIDQVLGYFVRTNTESYFPFFNWFIFPAFGLGFGEVYRHLQDKKKFFIRFLPFGAAFTAFYYIMNFCVDQNVFVIFRTYPDFTGMGTPDALACLVIVLTEIGIMAAIGSLLSDKVMKPFSFISSNINKFYCVSWCLIIFTYAILDGAFDIHVATDLGAVIVWVVLLTLTWLIIVIYKKWLEKPMGRFFRKKMFFWIALVWVGSAAIAIAVFPRITDYDAYPNYLNEYLEDSVTTASSGQD